MAAGNIDFAKVMAIVADFIVWLPALALLLQFLSDHHLLLESGLLLNSCMAALKTLQVSLSCPHGSQWNCHAWSSSGHAQMRDLIGFVKTGQKLPHSQAKSLRELNWLCCCT